MLAVNLTGCLWPTSLTDATQDDNVRPAFSGAVPAFGRIISTIGQTTELLVQAEDPNPDGELLHARLFTLGDAGPSSRMWTGEEIELTYIADGKTLSGRFYLGSGADLCRNFGDQAELYVVIADRPFNAPPMDNTSKGLTSENHWQLDCQ